LHEYERLLSRWTFGAEHAELMTILYGILARLSLEERHEPPLLAPVMEYIGQHFTSPTLSNTELARQANLSEVYFRRLFKQTYNTTPHRHVLDLRIRLAKQLLSEGITSVTAISETCGFASVYHFCRAFKTETGLSPSEYAKKA
jgi:AraC-like DNA-binding protein